MTCFPRHGIRSQTEEWHCPGCRCTVLGNPGEPLSHLLARVALISHDCPGDIPHVSLAPAGR